MSYSLNSLKGVIWGIIYGTTIGVIRGDTRSLDYSSGRRPVLRNAILSSTRRETPQSLKVIILRDQTTGQRMHRHYGLLDLKGTLIYP